MATKTQDDTADVKHELLDYERVWETFLDFENCCFDEETQNFGDFIFEWQNR